MLHCHIDWHLEYGMAVIFAEDVPDIPKDVTPSSKPPPAYLNRVFSHVRLQSLGISFALSGQHMGSSDKGASSVGTLSLGNGNSIIGLWRTIECCLVTLYHTAPYHPPNVHSIRKPPRQWALRGPPHRQVSHESPI